MLHDEDEINLRELFSILKKNWIIICSSGILVGILTYIVLIFVPNIYVSKMLLAPRMTQEESKLSGNVSALSALAGLKLGGSGDIKTPVALEVIKSRQFIVNFVRRRNITVELFALKSWDGKKHIYDADIYDTINAKWVRDVKLPKTSEPQDWEIFDKFSELLSVDEDENGFVTVSLEGKSPILVKRWLIWFIEDINEYMQARDKAALTKSMNFLRGRLEDVSFQDIRQVFYHLISEQTKKLMMTESHDDYVFEILDPAYQPAQPTRPKRLFILVAMMILTFILVGLFVIVREYSFVETRNI